MNLSFPHSIQRLQGWRSAVEARVDDLVRWITEHELGDEPLLQRLRSLRERLGDEKLIVAFVAEFSRGKSELINALFFADTGQRILPATPGRTTMSPVELGWQADEPPGMWMLPIETRLDARPLADWRRNPSRWVQQPLETGDAHQLATALGEVKRVRTVDVDTARSLGFWSDDSPADNPPLDAAGQVEIPAWRHVRINYPHPLLEQGLVVLDTPGLNAIGAEPELTLNLLPSAHATVFILAADTGVTRSDLDLWTDHLTVNAGARYVVLNKIDTLVDPLAPAGQAERQLADQVASQVEVTARTLRIDPARVFPLSARQALAARIAGDASGAAASGLPALESALRDDLLPRRRQLLEDAVVSNAREVGQGIERRLADRRRQLAEQMLELRGLRGKSAAKVRMMLQRVEDETAEFERSTTRLQALRLVQARLLKETLSPIGTERLKLEFAKLQAELKASFLNLGGKRAFLALCDRLRDRLQTTQQRVLELRVMLDGSFAKLNAESGFALSLGDPPGMDAALAELELLERNYAHYLGVGQALRLAQPAFMDQFRRMLLSKLGLVFETRASEIESWSRAAAAQVESQLRERRAAFKRRRESLERIQAAAGELEARLAELESHDRHLVQLAERSRTVVDQLVLQAQVEPVEIELGRSAA